MFLVLALAGHAQAAPMQVVDAKASVELDPLARGRLRRWLGTHVEICQIDTKLPAPTGDLKLHLDVAPKRATKVTVTGTPKPMAGCLTRHLRSVRFADLAPSLVWDGTLHLDPDGPWIEVAVDSMSGRLDAAEVRSAILAALEQPAACMTKFFAATPVLSAVVIAKLDATGAHVTASTADSDDTVACVASLLDPLVWPADQRPDARLRISLLRPTTKTDGAPFVDALTVPRP